MQMGFGLLYQQEREIGLGRVLELGEDGGHVEQVRVAEAGFGEVARVETGLFHAQAQSARDGADGCVRETETGCLWMRAFREPGEPLPYRLDRLGERFDDLDGLELAADFAEERLACLLVVQQALHDELDAPAAAGGEIPLCVAQRREIEMPDTLAGPGLGVEIGGGAAPGPPGKGGPPETSGRRGDGEVETRGLPVLVEGLAQSVQIAWSGGPVAGRQLDGLPASLDVGILRAPVAMQVVPAGKRSASLAVERQSEQPDRIHHIGLARVVLAHHDGDVRPEGDRGVRCRPEPAQVKALEVHDCSPRRECRGQLKNALGVLASSTYF
nr:hypothetical protein [Streptomyces chartreusis]